MKNNTENDYRKAIKAKYEIEKSGDFHGFLENPSPAQLREFCLLKFDNGLHKIDDAIFRIYFKINETDNLREAIYNYHIPKFKSVQSFLIEENKKTNIQNLNLIAALIDFSPRPYNKFTKDGYRELTSNSTTKNDHEIEGKKEIGSTKNPIHLLIGNTTETVINKPKSALKKRIAIGICIIAVIFSVGYTTKQLILPKKECMQWQDDKYVAIDCQSEINNLYAIAPIVPFDESTSTLKRLTVSDTTTFFEGEKAIIWYSKVNGVPEFFNGSGFHPVTGKGLRPVTKYIINKYVKK